MILERTLEFQGSKGEAQLQALFDSGATYSCVRPSDATELAHVLPLAEPIQIGFANIGQGAQSTQVICLDFYLNNIPLSDEFMVVPNLPTPIIIGAPTLRKWRIRLDVQRDEINIDPRVARRRL